MSLITSLLSLFLVACLLPFPIYSACIQSPLSFDLSPEVQAQARMAVYCHYGKERRALFTAWVDMQSCLRCVCVPTGLRCCSLGEACQSRK